MPMPPAATLRGYSYSMSVGELPSHMPSNAAARIVRLRKVSGPIRPGVNNTDSFMVKTKVMRFDVCLLRISI